MTRKHKRTLIRIAASGVVFAVGMLAPLEGIAKLIVFLAAYFIIGYDVLLRAAKNIFHGNVFDENFLMALATVGAFITGEYPEGVAVMLFYQVGELFQSIAVSKSRRSITELMDLRQDYANLIENGEVKKVSPEEVSVGDIILVKPGEKIPLDGKVVDGESFLDTAALTGESVPRKSSPGDSVLSGCVNGGGTLKIEVEKLFDESTASKILDMVENAASKKSKAENFITKFAKYYTPAVVIAAVLLAVVPPLILSENFAGWIHRALIFLVVSCPCALVISVPLTFFAGIGGASKKGVLIKGSNYFEGLSSAKTVVFDKTGTLTKGSFSVSAVYPSGVGGEELLRIAALAESFSSHPIALSIRAAAGATDDKSVSDVSEIAGKGVSAVIDGCKVFAGNLSLMEENGIDAAKPDDCGTVVYIARDGKFCGSIVISDEIKSDSADCIARLKQMGIRTVMLTGDNESAAFEIAERLKIDEYYSGLLPGDKVDHVERLLSETKGGSLIFAGDGINDAPVLSRADVGVAMGGIGSDAATEAADVVIMRDEPSKIPEAVSLAKKTMRIARQNIVFALAVKLVVLVLGALNMANMWDAVFADVGVSVIAILNAIRAARR